MTQCIQCQAPIEESFGLVTCGQCGASFFIGDDGEVESGTKSSNNIQEEESLKPFEDFQSESSENNNNEYVGNEAFVSEAPEGFENFEEIEELQPLNRVNEEGDYVGSGYEEASQKLESENYGQDEEIQDDEIYHEESAENSSLFLNEPDDEKKFEAHEQEEYAIHDPSFDELALGGEGTHLGPNGMNEISFQNPDENGPLKTKEAELSDIAQFANSEVSSVNEGPLLTTVKISNIHSNEQKSILFDYLNDSRFGWDAKSLIESEKEGQMVIANVSPLKASILIHQLKSENFEISWQIKGVIDA